MRGIKILDIRSPWQLQFVQWRPVLVDPRSWTCFMSPFWHLQFCGDSQIFGKSTNVWHTLYFGLEILHLCSQFSMLPFTVRDYSSSVGRLVKGQTTRVWCLDDTNFSLSPLPDYFWTHPASNVLKTRGGESNFLSKNTTDHALLIYQGKQCVTL